MYLCVLLNIYHILVITYPQIYPQTVVDDAEVYVSDDRASLGLVTLDRFEAVIHHRSGCKYVAVAWCNSLNIVNHLTSFCHRLLMDFSCLTAQYTFNLSSRRLNKGRM